MPIINGTYVTPPLGTPENAQKQVFGEYNKADMNDYSQAAYNYLQQQQQQAFEYEMWNLKNEYDSPKAQMLRYQQAGLNPNLIYGQQNVSGNIPQGSPATFRSSGTMARGTQLALNAVNDMMSTVKAARETYDYFKFGTTTHAWQNALLMNQGEALSLQNLWNRWLLGRGDDNSVPLEAPKRTLWQTQFDQNVQKYEQLVALVESIKDTRLRTQALTALDKYRLEILRGQYGFLNNISTGHVTVDSFLKMVGYFLLSQ